MVNLDVLVIVLIIPERINVSVSKKENDSNVIVARLGKSNIKEKDKKYL